MDTYLYVWIQKVSGILLQRHNKVNQQENNIKVKRIWSAKLSGSDSGIILSLLGVVTENVCRDFFVVVCGKMGIFGIGSWELRNRLLVAWQSSLARMPAAEENLAPLSVACGWKKKPLEWNQENRSKIRCCSIKYFWVLLLFQWVHHLHTCLSVPQF